ncbi:MAG TPA: GNAT family N-acyltransferase [Paracoccaceae bacterium]|nr:GNAT family N-acyltransferase [Paracoccaceae bacterium]
MTTSHSKFSLRLASDPADIRAAHRLRYRVFVEELGGSGPLVDHEQKLEADRFDPYFDHLVLIDERLPKGDHVIGVYRVLRGEQAEKVGQFYSEDEYDLSALKSSGRRLLELGRSCVDARYRGGMAMYRLWNGLASYVADHGVEILFGVASFHGTDVQAIAEPLSHLHYRHLAPEDIRVRAVEETFQRMDLIPEDQIDRRRAMAQTPALIKAYLRIGGFVGEGAYVDHAFNTTDVCLILDTARMNEAQRALYTKGRGQ